MDWAEAGCEVSGHYRISYVCFRSAQRVKSSIAEIQPMLEESEKEYECLGDKYSQQSSQMKRVRDKLAQEWSALNHQYLQRYER